jgi:nucleotide-binding universal stress UspA family protein
MMSDTVERFRREQYTVLVGLGYPERVEGLMRIASVFARRQKGRIVATSVVLVPDDADLEQGAEYADPDQLGQAEQMVEHAQDFGAELGIAVDPLVEFAHDIATGIAHVCREADADMILLGFSPPERPEAESAAVPARITERVASMTGPSLAIVALPDGDEPARMLIPVTESLDPAIIRDLGKIVALFGGAQMTFIGLLPRGLTEAQFQERSDALRAKLDEIEFDEIECVDIDARDASRCLFGAEARQMAGESHEAAFIIRTTV